MVNRKKFSTKLKSTPKKVPRTRKTSLQENSNTPKTPLVNNKQDRLAENIKIVKEEFKAHKKKLSEIIKSNLRTTSKRFSNISTEVFELKESFQFMPNQLDEEIKQKKE